MRSTKRIWNLPCWCVSSGMLLGFISSAIIPYLVAIYYFSWMRLEYLEVPIPHASISTLANFNRLIYVAAELAFARGALEHGFEWMVRGAVFGLLLFVFIRCVRWLITGPFQDKSTETN